MNGVGASSSSSAVASGSSSTNTLTRTESAAAISPRRSARSTRPVRRFPGNTLPDDDYYHPPLPVLDDGGSSEDNTEEVGGSNRWDDIVTTMSHTNAQAPTNWAPVYTNHIGRAYLQQGATAGYNINRGSSSRTLNLPVPKYDVAKSHPIKLAKGYRRTVVPPEQVVVLHSDDSAESGSEGSEAEYEEVPCCAACPTELFLAPAPPTEADGKAALKSAHARPHALKCGHLICAQCAADGKKRLGGRSKGRGGRGKARGKKGRGRASIEANGGMTVIDLDSDVAIWTGCPVYNCDGAGTAWNAKVGDVDGLWQVFF